jgi:hypothetical protein
VKEARASADRAGLSNGKGSLIAAFYQTGPVLDGAGHVAAVDKVERRSNRPVGFDIVDFEGDIGGTLDLLIRRVLEFSVCSGVFFFGRGKWRKMGTWFDLPFWLDGAKVVTYLC